MKIPAEKLLVLSKEYGIEPDLALPDAKEDWHLCRYFAFYDVPNGWLGHYRGDYVFARREFEEAIDDFPPVWQVFRVPDFSAEDLFARQLADFREQEFLGELPISALRFHPDRPRNYERGMYFAWFHGR
ncbi:MAG: hypothetical protein QM758_29950 [Armatimonas sp.]